MSSDGEHHEDQQHRSGQCLTAQAEPALQAAQRRGTDEPSWEPVQECVAVASAEEVADLVTCCRADDGGRDDRPQRQAARVGHDPADQDGDLTGEDQAEEHRGLERGHHGDQGQHQPRGEPEDQVDDAAHEVCGGRSEGFGSSPSAVPKETEMPSNPL